ncbi:MAG: TonB C-terminal domain-containing protein [Bdellovibrio sp.]|nr:TonB C-terminal domain-containing protein [Methylotenera sp.]
MIQSTHDPILDDEIHSPASIWLKRLLIALLGLAVLAGIGYGLKKLMSGGSAKHSPKVTKIALKDLPPPPPPPPPKEQPKEIPKPTQQKEVKVDQPKPAPAPPTEVLKMDGPAGSGDSPFAAGNPTGEYKGEALGDTKTIGGGPDKHQFDWYTGLIKEKIEDAITKDKALASGAYKIVVKVWIASNGRIQRYELTNSTGDTAIDGLIKKALDDMPAISEAPPSDMPQPVKLRVTARSVG